MQKNIFAYGFDLPQVEGFYPESLASARSMLDADIIIVEPSLNAFSTYGSYQGAPRLEEHSSSTYRETRVRWASQLDAALKAGRTVIFFLTEPQKNFFYSGRSTNQGTSGKPRFTNLLQACSNYDFLPLKLAKMSVADGVLFDITKEGSEFLAEYWIEFGQHSTYRCYFEDIAESTTLLTTKGGGHAVAAKLRVDSGNLIILPELTWGHLSEGDGGNQGDDDYQGSDDDQTEERWSEDYLQFTLRLRDALFGLDRRLRVVDERTEAPEWVAASVYRFDTESVTEREMLDITTEIERFRTQHAELKLQLERDGGLRALLYETGPRLEAAVREALEILGFEVQHFADDQSEFDAIFTGPEGRFIGEVEGRDNKAIDVKKASQLHRNVSEDFARDDVDKMATGVLFGNPFRLRPPEEREDAFTRKVVTFAATVSLALVRTTDLFVAAQRVRNSGDMAFAERCREAFAAGRGSVVQFPVAEAAESTETLDTSADE